MNIKEAIRLLEEANYIVIAPYSGTCQLPECGKEFTTKKGAPGSPRTKFCCEEHRLTFNNRNAILRVARWREKKRRESQGFLDTRTINVIANGLGVGPQSVKPEIISCVSWADLRVMPGMGLKSLQSLRRWMKDAGYTYLPKQRYWRRDAIDMPTPQDSAG